MGETVFLDGRHCYIVYQYLCFD